MYQCEPVGLDFIDTAPFRFRNRVDLAITPAQVFEVFADAQAWPRWASAITKVTWTSPEPRGVGTTRVVEMRGGMVGDEEFIAWEPYRHMAFRFNRCSTRAVSAFAEDYRVEPIGEGCRVTWTMAQRPAGMGRWTMPLAGPVMNVMLRRFLANLRRYTDERYATAGRT